MAKENVVKIPVTKSHFVKAEKAGKKGSVSITETCLVVQAVRSAFPRKHVEVGNVTVSVSRGMATKEYRLDSTGARLIARFDNGRLRKRLFPTLPTSFKMTLEPFASSSGEPD